MSFGFGVGDFTTVIQLAYKTYDRCRTSVAEFQDLSKEVASLRIVLEAIADHWKEEAHNDNDLSDNQKAQLKELSEGCEEVLNEIQALLDKHSGLGAKQSLRQRLRWVTKDIAPIRSKLLLRTTLLATLNSSIISTSNADLQRKREAELLEALNKIHREYEDGHRTREALSEVTLADLDSGKEEAWSEIASELSTEGIAPSTIEGSRAFVRSWIQQVVLEDISEANEPGSGLKEDGNETIAEQPEEVQSAANGTEGTWYSPSVLWSSEIPSRTRDQDKPPEKSGPEKASELLETLFLSSTAIFANPADNDIIENIADHAWNQLDWYKSDRLNRTIVESVFQNPLKAAGIFLTAKELDEFSQIGDKNHDGMIDRHEFAQMVTACLGMIQVERQKEMETKGFQDMREQLISMHKAGSITLPPPSKPWQPAGDPDSWQISDLGDLLKTKVNPLLHHRDCIPSFRVMALLLSRSCVPRINKVLDAWSRDLSTLPQEILDEYLNSIKHVLTAASKFSVFEVRNNSLVHEQLDDVYYLASLIPNAISTNFVNSIRVVSNVFIHAHKLFCRIAAFTAFLEEVHSSNERAPAAFESWGSLHMAARASLVNSAAQSSSYTDLLTKIEYPPMIAHLRSLATVGFCNLKRMREEQKERIPDRARFRLQFEPQTDAAGFISIESELIEPALNLQFQLPLTQQEITAILKPINDRKKWALNRFESKIAITLYPDQEAWKRSKGQASVKYSAYPHRMIEFYFASWSPSSEEQVLGSDDDVPFLFKIHMAPREPTHAPYQNLFLLMQAINDFPLADWASRTTKDGRRYFCCVLRYGPRRVPSWLERKLRRPKPVDPSQSVDGCTIAIRLPDQINQS